MRTLSKILFSLFLLVSSTMLGQNLTKPLINGPAGIRVNSFTGNMFYQRNDLFIPGRGLSFDMTFSYNSGENAKDWGYGNGWTFTYNMLYEQDGANIVIRRGDGRRDVYTYNGSGYDHPVGIFDVLTEYETGKFRLRSKYGIEYFFDNATHKRLTKIQDPNSNTVTIQYAAGLPTQITDVSGRVLTLTWVDGHLSQITDANTSPTRTILFFYDEIGRAHV